MNNQSLGEYLAAERRKRSLSQREFAEMAGISQASLSLIERGERPLPTSAARRLAESLGIDARRLLGQDPLDAASKLHEQLWRPYDELLRDYKRLCFNIQALQQALHPHRSLLSGSTNDLDGRQALDLVLDPAVHQRLLERARAKEKLAEYTTTKAFAEYAQRSEPRDRLYTIADRLGADDVELLITLALRLAPDRDEKTTKGSRS